MFSNLADCFILRFSHWYLENLGVENTSLNALDYVNLGSFLENLN